MYICPMEQERVAQYINQKRLFMPTDKVIIALSGGADSVALLCLLQTLGTTAKPHTAISTSAAKNLTETRHLSVNYVQSGKFHYISSILILYVQPKNDISPLKWQRGNYVTNGLKKYAEKAVPMSLP